jgi:hypothetical protein
VPIVIAIELRFGVYQSFMALLRLDNVEPAQAGAMTYPLIFMCSILIGSLLANHPPRDVLAIQGLVIIFASLWR